MDGIHNYLISMRIITLPYFRSVSLGFLLLAAICGLGPKTVQAAEPFANGADVSWLPQMEADGYKFYNASGTQQDCLHILKDLGIDSIRLRVWVNPNQGHCDKAETIAMAVRAKTMGFRIMIDFHYSDTWADGGKQYKPAAWKNHDFNQLLTDVQEHTCDVMNALATNGIHPEWVQVGNEINCGMLWPEGSSTNMSQLAALLTSGSKAIKMVSPNSKVVIHLSEGLSVGYDNASFRRFFDALAANGTPYDVIGISYYPSSVGGDYSTTLDTIFANLNDMISRYGKPVMACELGGPYTETENTYNYLSEVLNALKAIPNGNGLGAFYWEPQGAYSWSRFNLCAWGSDGKPTLAMNAFKQPNLVKNPSFDTGSMSNWTPWSSSGNSDAVSAQPGGHSGSHRLNQWKDAPYQASAHQTITGLVNGTYALSAYVKRGGAQNICQLYAKNFGGAEKNYILPTTGNWTQITITGIQVSNGQCEIGLYSDAKAGGWCNMDDVKFYKSLDTTITEVPDSLYPAPNLVVPTWTDYTKGHYPEKISEFKNHPLDFHDIVFLGDSITEGGDWGRRFEQAKVKNRGISGDVTDGVLNRLNEIYYFKPAAVFILIGINDLFNSSLSSEYVANNVVKIAANIRQNSPETRVYVRTILPTSTESLREKIKKANEILRSEASSKNYTLIDLHPLFSDDKDLIKKEYTRDGVHLNEDGYKLWADFEKDHVTN